jgi:inorganic triphosphatase YgiF
MEIELKLLASPRHLARIARHPLIDAAPPRVERLHAIYFDTPKRDLARAGLALRLRSDGTRWIQSLKGGGDAAAAGLQVREELEWEVPYCALDFAALSQSKYGELFAGSGMRKRLAPVFTTAFERTAWPLALPDGTKIELALDRGEIQAGKRRAAISEAELELKEGNARQLFALARELGRTVPLRLGTASKAERGYALANGSAVEPQKAMPLQLDAGMTAGAALRRIALACLAQMHANEAGVLAARDPEFLHQFRVGLRRLRSCLRLMHDERLRPLRAELRWLQTALGRARDWHVFTAAALAPLARVRRKEVTAFRARGTKVLRAHEAQARAAVRSPRYAALLLALGEALAGDDYGGAVATRPLREFAATVLARHHRRLRKLGAALRQATPPARHQARIAAKRLRYAAEFFSGLYEEARVQPYVKALRDLQDVLGALNDAAVVDALLAETGAVPLYVAGWAAGWVTAVEARELDAYDAAWRRFRGAHDFWS